MTLLFMDGFDVQDAALKWSGGGTNSYITTPRFGVGKSLFAASTGLTRNFTASSQVFAGAAINTNTLGRDIFNFKGDAGVTSHVCIWVTTGGQIQIIRGNYVGTVVASSAAGLINLNTWYYLEASATISDTVGVVNVNLNGVQVLTFTGDTKNAGTNTTIDALGLLIAGTAISYDDLYVCNSVGSVNNTFLGDVRVQTLLPSGAGASTQFTPSAGSNFSNVNTVPYNTTAYNSDSTSGHRDTYAMGDLAAGTGTVFGVQDNIIALKSDAGSANLKAALKSGASVYYDATQPLSASAIVYSALRETDPATSAAWTTTNVNALEFGAEVA